MGAVRAFSAGNYTHRPGSESLSVNSVDLPVLMDADSDVNKDISSGKMLESIATVEVLIKHSFFAFIPYIYLLVGSQISTVFSGVVNGIDITIYQSHVTSKLDVC